MFRPVIFVVGLAVVIGGCKMPAEEPPAQLEEFVSKEWKFKVKFPGKPENKQQDAKQQIGARTIQIKVVMFSKSFRNEGFIVGVTDIPTAFEPDPIETQLMLEKGREAALANSGATLESSKSILFQGRYQGMEILAKSQPPKGPADGLLRARVYVVGKRVYQTIVAGTATAIKEPRVAEFLDSFQVTD
ncbi:MAG: hypothetical protein K8U57_30150 [Planctomycetes bacterium]|nr:hypothetical protein [Planctomycetota bacterium]